MSLKQTVNASEYNDNNLLTMENLALSFHDPPNDF